MSRKDRKNLPPPTEILVYVFAMSLGEVSADCAAAVKRRLSGVVPTLPLSVEYRTSSRT
jgi:hypothetical protein